MPRFSTSILSVWKHGLNIRVSVYAFEGLINFMHYGIFQELVKRSQKIWDKLSWLKTAAEFQSIISLLIVKAIA